MTFPPHDPDAHALEVKIARLERERDEALAELAALRRALDELERGREARPSARPGILSGT